MNDPIRKSVRAGKTGSSTWLIYMLLCGDGTLYTGISNNLEARLRAHRLGRAGARYTRGRGPLRLVYVEPAEDRSTASRREAAIKHLARIDKCHLALTKPQHPLVDRKAIGELRRRLMTRD